MRTSVFLHRILAAPLNHWSMLYHDNLVQNLSEQSSTICMRSYYSKEMKNKSGVELEREAIWVSGWSLISLILRESVYHLVWVPFPWQYELWTRERLVFSLIWECGIILHVWGIYITSSYMRVSLATEVGVLVGDGSLGLSAVVSPTSIPLREVLVLPDAETHITHRQQHTHRHVHKLLTQNV